EVLDEIPVAILRDALRKLDHVDSGQIGYHWSYDTTAIVARVRLELLSGASVKEVERLRTSIPAALDWTEIVWAASFPAFDPVLFERIDPAWQWELAFMATADTCLAWRADTMPVCEWGIAKLATAREQMPESLRLTLAELLVHRGEHARAEQALGTLKSGAAGALRACML